MSLFEEALLEVLLAYSPILIAMIIGAICWAARYFGEPTKRNDQSRCETRRNRPVRANGGVRHG